MAKVLWEDRYFNVFFAYRGAGDLALSPGRQLEDNLTRALAATLKRVSASTARSFAVDLAGIDPGKGELRDVLLQPARSETQAVRRVLLGISPSGQVARGSLQVDAGGARPDAAFVWDGTAIFLEVRSCLISTAGNSPVTPRTSTSAVQR